MLTLQLFVSPASSVYLVCFACPREQVIANIRGGGEYGPKWHQAALKEKRHKAYEDVEVGGGVVEWLVVSVEG